LPASSALLAWRRWLCRHLCAASRRDIHHVPATTRNTTAATSRFKVLFLTSSLIASPHVRRDASTCAQRNMGPGPHGAPERVLLYRRDEKETDDGRHRRPGDRGTSAVPPRSDGLRHPRRAQPGPHRANGKVHDSSTEGTVVTGKFLQESLLVLAVPLAPPAGVGTESAPGENRHAGGTPFAPVGPGHACAPAGPSDK